MLKLFKANETNFDHNETILKDVVSAEVFEESNGEFSLTIEYPAKLNLEAGQIIEAPTPRGPQLFRIVKPTRVIGQRDYFRAYCRHIFYDLLDNFIEDTRPTNKTAGGALEDVLNGTQYTHRFTGTSDISATNTAYYIRQNPVQAIMGSGNSVLGLWGGHIVRDNFEITIKEQSLDRGYEVRFGKNLIGLDEEIDVTEVVTRIYPTVVINEPIVTALPEKYIDSPLIATYPEPVIRELRVELTDAEKELPVSEIYDIMRQKAQEQFTLGGDKPLVNYKVDFLHYTNDNAEILKQLDLNDTVRVVIDKYGINLSAKVIKYTYDSIKEKYLNMELGNFKESLANQRVEIGQIIDEINKTISNNNVSIADKMKAIGDMISGNNGGYKIDRFNELGQPYETLYMDSPNLNTAVNVIRLNKSGIGFSTSGYNGPFNTAITIDGKIMGQYIVVNSLEAISANLGTMVAGRIQDADNESYWDLNSKEIKLNVNELKIQSKDVATEESVSGAIGSATSPLITRISQAEQKITSDAIVSTVRSSTQYATDQSAKENTIYKSTTAPPSPTLNKLWLDLSVVPNVIRRWTGTEWVKTSPTTAQDIAYSPSNPASLEEVVTGAVSRLEQADTDITAMFEQIQEGARNLLDGSTRLWSNANFKHSEYPLAENVEVGEIVSIALKGYLGAGRTSFALYNTYADSYITSLTSLDYKDGIYTASFPWVGTENASLVIYQQPEAGATISRIEWATLVRGDTPVRRQIKTQSELYTGIVRLFKDGITVGRSDTEVQTWLAYDGVRILTGLNSVPLAEFTLDGAETSRLYAGRAYAENMANCFRGTVDVYVGASPTGDGSGKDELNLSDGVMTAINYALDGARNLESSAVINVRIQGVKKNEAVLIRGISGDGTINLIGAYGSTQIAGNIQIRNCTCRINLNGITLVNVDTNQAFGLIHVSGLCNVSIDSCRLDGGNVKNGVTAISGAKVRITGTPTVNCLSAYYADDLSEIFAYDNFGQGNINVAHSRMGSRIFLYDRRPNGTNPVLTATGGMVDDQGVGTGSSFSYTPPAFTNSTKTFYPLKAGTYYSGESFVFATEWRQGRATNGKVVIGFAEFGSQIKDWLESAGGYQGTPTIQIYADRNLSIGGGSVSMKIGTPSAMTLPAVVRGGKTSGTAPGALASSMVASSNLTLKSNTTSATDYGGFKIRVVVTAQKKV